MTMKKKLFALFAAFSVGAAAMLLVVAASTFLHKQAKAQEDWFFCTRGNMPTILVALREFTETNKAGGPVTLETLVQAKRLPEWSAIYVCPTILEPGVADSFWPNEDKTPQFNPFLPSPIAAHYSRSSYYIESISNNFRIRCRYHTNNIIYLNY